MSNKITAGEAYVAISVDSTGLAKGLQETSQKITQAAREISALEPELSPKINIDAAPVKAALAEIRAAAQETAKEGLNLSDFFVVTAGDVANFIKGAAGTLSAALGAVGDKFDKMSQRVGVSTTALSELGHAATMCGADVSNIEGAFRSMATLTLNANNGVKKSSDTFQRLGVDLAFFNTLDPARQFQTLAEKIAAIPDPTLRAAEAMKVFGSDGQRLLPLFNAGVDGMRELQEEARDLGAVIDEDAAKMGADYVDATTRMKTALSGLGNSLARAFTPVVVDVANAFAKFVGAISELSREHKTLTTAVVFATGAIGGLSLVMGAIPRVAAAYALSVKQLKLALDFLQNGLAHAKSALLAFKAACAAHPYLTLAAALAGVVVVLKKISDAKIPKLHVEATETFKQGEEDRADDRAAIERLEELRKKQKLSNEETVEAARLVAQLRARYGEVGYAVDVMAGKVTAATNAQAELNKKMNERRAAELRAAIKERKLNLETDAFGAEMRKKEVSDWEFKQRGVSWGHALTHIKSFENDDERRKYILEHDEKFQKRYAAAKETEETAIATLEEELNALETLNKQAVSQTPAADVDEGVFNEINVFIKTGVKVVEKSVDESCQEIDEQAERLRDALIKLVDPHGEMTGLWGDLNAENRYFEKNPAAFEHYAQAKEVAASAERQKSELLERQRKEREAEEKKIADAEARAAETFAARQKSDWLDVDKRRETLQGRLAQARTPEVADALRRQLARVDVDVDRDRQIDAINKETDAYKQQLQAVIDLEEAKRQRGEGYDVQRVARMQQALASAEIDRAQKVARARNAADAKQQEKESTALKSAYDRLFEKFATPFEKLQRAGEEVRAAYAALAQAQESNDSVLIANALDRLGESQEKYANAQDAAKAVGSAMKSIGGTFSAWQAASLTSQINYDKQLYNETKAQSRYLLAIARNTSVNAAAFL